MKRPRIAFVSASDPRDVTSWSGTTSYMASSLQRHVGEVAYVGPLRPPQARWIGLRDRAMRRLVGRCHPVQNSVAVARAYGELCAREIPANADLVFAPAGSSVIAFLETRLPVVYTSDATFERLVGYYPDATTLSEAAVREGNEVERRALERADLVLYPSRWAADSALSFYGVPGEKVHVFPYGANLDVVPERGRIAPAKRADVCTLTFLGVDWERKGGPLALRTVLALREMGIDARLVVCGCVPPVECDPAVMTVIPRLDKRVPEQQEKLSRLLLDSTFLLLPTRGECYGVVFCEAAAHGTPSISTRTGGVPGAVVEGRSGFLLPEGAGPQEYASLIAELFRDRRRYEEMVESSRRVYEETHNWDAWGRKVEELVAGIR